MSTTFWIKALELILALGILVMIHEFGHYFFARVFGVWVEKFYLFFNPWLTIAKWKPGKYFKWFSHGNEMAVAGENDLNENKKSWRATEYGLGWLPLGGYCSIAGMIDESMNTEAMKEPAKSWEFRSKPAWQRLLIMLGGVLFNFLLAIVIYAGIVYSVGEEYVKFSDATSGMIYCDSAHKVGFVDGDIPLSADYKELVRPDAGSLQAMLTCHQVKVLRNHKDTIAISIPDNFIFQVNSDAEKGHPFMIYCMPLIVDQVQPRMGGEKAGLMKGDRLLAVNDVPTPDITSFSEELAKYKNKNVTLRYQRGNQELTAVDVPIDGNGMLGITKELDPSKIFKSTVIHYNLLQSIPRGIEMGWDKMVNYVKQLKYVFTPEGAQSLGGFGAIGSIFPEKWNWLDFWNITALISVILAVMNILPIPALDGGHVLFLLYEIITGRQPSLKFMEKAQMVGMALLIALLLFANGNDIYRYFFK